MLFRQQRIGRGGNRFSLLKLRTMDADAEARRAEMLPQSKGSGAGSPWSTTHASPGWGACYGWPALSVSCRSWNVLRGDMSLVKPPRPLIAEEDGRVDDWARGRLDLTPGVTGLWQVLGRASIPFGRW